MKRLAFLLLLLPGILFAQDDPSTESGRDKNLSPYFWVPNASPDADTLPLKSTQVEATLAGVIADVRVTQVYANTGTTPIEAVYVFPGSTRAAVHGLSLTVGERRIEARVQERQQARKTYEAAKTAGKTTSLLEQRRPNVFQMNVANILPGDEVRVELRYTELLVPTDGIYEFVYPGVVGPRYSKTPAANSTKDDDWVRNPYLPTNTDDPATFSIAVNCLTGVPMRDAACHTHRTDIVYTDPASARITLDSSETNGANRDFILRYRLAGDALQAGLLVSEGRDENFFLAMIQPPARPIVAELPPRDYLFVVDVSGSMRGFPLETARTLLRQLFPGLRPQDTFNILLFSGGSRTLSPRSLPATPANLQSALRLLSGEDGGGGTELLPALHAAFALPRSENLSRIIAVITDGYVNIEAEAFDLVRSHADKGNVFAFGIGASVNRHLIESLARAGQGEPFIVTDPAMAESVALEFQDYIAAPVLTAAKLEFTGLDAYDIEPRSLPDVFAQRPVIAFGKWRGPRTGSLTLRGLTGGAPFSTTLDLAQARTVPGAGLSHLWARHRIRQLMDDIASQSTPERIAEVTTLGLGYNLLTRYTSFVAVDEVVRRAGEELKTVKQPLPLPQGVGPTAVGDGGDIPTSPEPGTFALMLIAAIAILIPVYRRRKKGAAAILPPKVT
jgi:Ca-activated chloride channel family protein